METRRVCANRRSIYSIYILVKCHDKVNTSVYFYLLYWIKEKVLLEPC